MKKKNNFTETLIKLELKYENFGIFFLSVVIAYIILTPPYLQMLEEFIFQSHRWGYLGAAIAGFGYSYGITTPVAIAVFYILGTTLNPFYLAFLGAFGAAISDYFLFIITKKTVGRKIHKIESHHRKASRFLHRFAPLIAMAIILSPFPDEIAASYMGSIQYNRKKFLILAYFANFIGLLLIAGVGSYFG